MSAEALSLLEDSAPVSSVPEKSTSQQTIDLLEGKSSVSDTVQTRITGPEVAKRMMRGAQKWYSASPVTGLAELGAQGVTSMGGKILGGLAGLGTGLANFSGLTDADPTDVIHRTEDLFTYQPQSSSAQMIGGAMDKVLHAADPLMLPVERRLDEINPEIVPTIAAAGEAALDIAPFVGAAKAVRGASGAAPNRMVSPSESPATAFSDGSNPFARESMGAAAVPPNLKNVSPELRAEVQKQAYRGGVDRTTLERHIEADTLPVRMRLTEGQATQDPVKLSIEMNRRGKDPALAQVFHQQNQQLIDNLDEIRAASSPTTVALDPLQSGQALIDAYKSYDAPIRDSIRAKYKALEEANGGQFPVDGSSFVAAADRALSKKMKGRYVPSQIAGDLADFRDGGPMTFEQFENLRTNLAAEARKAERSGDGNAAMAVNIVRETLEDLPMSEASAPIKKLADEARRAARSRFEQLREDPAYRAAVNDGVDAGELSPEADKFIEKYVVRSKAAHLQRMRQHLSGDESANELIAGGALNYLKSKAGINAYTNEGNFSQAGYNRALSELSPKLEMLVGRQTDEQLRQLGNVARYTQAQPRGSFVNNSNTLVGALAQKGANIAESVVNNQLGGLPVGTAVRNKLEERASRKFVENATKPGAGIQMKEKK